MVNRIWQHHFGIGLVKTAENFGVQGEPPSHPELLDWLATELVRTGWDVKAMHKLIVTSATYPQASTAKPALVAHDPENRLLAADRGSGSRPKWCATMRWRSAACWSADRRAVDQAVPAGRPVGRAGRTGREGPYVQDKGAKLYGRSLYVYRKRTVPHPVMATFDAPSREICQVKRARTNTPLQALELLNDVTYVEAARQLAQLALNAGGLQPRGADHLRLPPGAARMPTPRELDVLRRGLERYRKDFEADKDAAVKLIRHGESPPDPKVDPVELAAYTATASVILNLDETITLE